MSGIGFSLENIELANNLTFRGDPKNLRGECFILPFDEDIKIPRVLISAAGPIAYPESRGMGPEEYLDLIENRMPDARN